MKIKILIFLMLLINLTACNSKKNITFLGEIINVQDTSFIDRLNDEYPNINTDFATNKFYIKDFYNKLDFEAVNLINNNKISDVLNNSSKIIFNIGNSQIVDCVYDNKINVNDKDLELFDYYFHHSLDVLMGYTKDIIVIPFYNSLMLNEDIKEEYNNLIIEYNKIVYQNCSEFNVKYCNIDRINFFVYKNNFLSSSGIDYLFKQLKNE